MPRPMPSKEVSDDAPYRNLDVNSKENARKDARGNVESTVPITHHYCFLSSLD